MKNKDGIVIKAGQVWVGRDAQEREIVAEHKAFIIIEALCDAVPGVGPVYLISPDCHTFSDLLKSHDGADLEASRDGGWEIWVEGMAVPTLGTVGVLQSYAGRSCGFVPEEPSVSLRITHTYRYKLKKEPVGYQAYKDAPDHQEKILPIETEESYTQNDTESPRLRCFRKLADAEAWLKEDEKPKYKLFEIDWSSNCYPCLTQEGGGITFGIGLWLDVDGYRVFGFTDDERWVDLMMAVYDEAHQDSCFAKYETEPSDHEGDRKYAIGRLF